MTESITSQDLLVMTVDLVSSFVSHNSVRAAELPEMIAAVHQSLTAVSAPKPIEEPAPELKPAVPIKKSVTDDFIISLEDGRKFKSMKRYLSGLGMTPQQYRERWGLPADYPMVAPGYAAKRSELAKASGLGSDRRKPAIGAPVPQASAPEPVAEPAPKKRARPAKMAA